MKQRIEWLDFMKAFAIFIVVLGHVGHRFGEPYPVYVNFIEIIEMPFFFMLSGMLAGNMLKKNFKTFLYNKVISLLLPFLTCGTIYSIMFNRFDDYLFDQYHCGYWFLPSLFICSSIFFILGKLVKIIIPCCNEYIKVSIFVLTLLIPYYLAFYAISVLPNDVTNFFSLYNTFYNYWFYIIGYLLMSFRHLMQKRKEIFISISFVLFAFGYWCCVKSMLIPISLKTMQFMLSITLLGILYGVYNLQSNKLKLIANCLGQRTLGVYLFHFFLSPFFVLTPFSGYSIGFQFIIGILVSSFVILLCLGLISFIKHYYLLNYILLGSEKR